MRVDRGGREGVGPRVEEVQTHCPPRNGRRRKQKEGSKSRGDTRCTGSLRFSKKESNCLAYPPFTRRLTRAVGGA